jgi:hypothetical protein
MAVTQQDALHELRLSFPEEDRSRLSRHAGALMPSRGERVDSATPDPNREAEQDRSRELPMPDGALSRTSVDGSATAIANVRGQADGDALVVAVILLLTAADDLYAALVPWVGHPLPPLGLRAVRAATGARLAGGPLPARLPHRAGRAGVRRGRVRAGGRDE